MTDSCESKAGDDLHAECSFGVSVSFPDCSHIICSI